MNSIVTIYIVSLLLRPNKKKYPNTTQSIGIGYWYWLLVLAAILF